MVSYFISDNVETFVGLKLSGISGILLTKEDKILSKINNILSSRNVGILIITENISKMFPDMIKNIRLKRKFPLIVEVPDANGFKKDSDFITKYINESIGIKI